MKRTAFFLGAFLIILAGCKVGPNYIKPSVKTMDHFRFSQMPGDSVLNLAWWELFSDPVLTSLIDSAIARNQHAMMAASRIEEARAALGYYKADQWPVLGYDGSAGRSKINVPSLGVSDPFNSFQGMATLAWELDFWGKYRRATEAARAELLASEYGQQAVLVSLISDVAYTYFLLLDLDARLEISEKTLISRTESKRIIGERFDKGIVPEIDLNQAEIQEAIAAAAVPYYKRQVAQIENALSILLGNNPGPIYRTGRLSDQPVPPDVPTGIPSTILERRPDINQAEQTLMAQNARIGVAVAMRFPSISLTGMFGAASNDLSNLISNESMVWSLSGGILGPIFQFGKNKRRVDIERELMVQDSLAYVETVLQAFREVEDALIEVSTLREESVARQRQMKAAENAAMLSKERYNGGVTSYLEVLDSERSQFEAQLAASETYQLYLNSYVFLYKALGGGWISKEEMQQAQNQPAPGQ